MSVIEIHHDKPEIGHGLHLGIAVSLEVW